ncbi:ABC transporter permease [Rhizobium leguminosarum]|uniref:ABC transporter permease n=1 Tax=Rhizobium leguminosarum TaxID=384 RepID=UPI00143F88FE|nr:ABC transporter permease [Rhizobium leguminosarum]NKL21215.1 ABC transporter permease [Rhizobium leguminosarum bv. viciae]NKL56918.1 ABC transporter permease [Rhizobium leguminosarum bv. viciae]
MTNQTLSRADTLKLSESVRSAIQTFGIGFVFLAICIFFSLSSEFFLSWNNVSNVLRQSSINGILAVGVTFVILTGGIDLSVGSVMALVGVVAGSMLTLASPYPMPLGIGVGLMVGCLCGLVSGALVAYLRLPSFVATLGMLSMARGLTLIYTDGRPIPNLLPEFKWLGAGTVAGVPVPAVILLAVFIVAWVTLKHTSFGRYIYAVGGNERAAKASGVSTRFVITMSYVVSGVLAGLGGLLLTARTTAALPQAGVGYELDAIAAVVIGGTSLAGGRGTLVGSLFGALIIGTLNNGMDLLGISSNYQQFLKGAIIIAAVIVDRSRK